MVAKLQNRYRWLYFVPGHLVSKLYGLLTSDPPSTEQVVNEVVHLFPQEVDVVKVRKKCNVSLECKLALFFQNMDILLYTNTNIVFSFITFLIAIRTPIITIIFRKINENVGMAKVPKTFETMQG